MNKSLPLISSFFAAIIFFTFSLTVTAGENPPTTGQIKDRSIVFKGKAYCPLKRAVLMPFTGIFTDILIKPGQRVTEGETVVRYNLEENKSIELGQKILFGHIDNLRYQVEVEKDKISELQRKEKELAELTVEKLSPQHALDTLRDRLRFARAHLSLLKKRLQYAEQFSKKELNSIRTLLGNSNLQSGQFPQVVQLKAPISGIVLSLHPGMRKLSLLPEWTAVAHIGQMDTMLIRSLVYEQDAAQLKVGDSVTFYPDSDQEKKISATISSINWTPANLDPNQPSYYTVEMESANNDLTLREGYKGRVEYILRGNE